NPVTSIKHQLMPYPALFAIPHGIRQMLFWFVFMAKVSDIRILWFCHLAKRVLFFFSYLLRTNVKLVLRCFSWVGRSTQLDFFQFFSLLLACSLFHVVIVFII